MTLKKTGIYVIMTMSKIDGKYEQFWTEDLRRKIDAEDYISKRHPLILRYLRQRSEQIESILANAEDDDIDLLMVVEQLWDDLKLASNHMCGLNTERI